MFKFTTRAAGVVVPVILVDASAEAYERGDSKTIRDELKQAQHIIEDDANMLDVKQTVNGSEAQLPSCSLDGTPVRYACWPGKYPNRSKATGTGDDSHEHVPSCA